MNFLKFPAYYRGSPNEEIARSINSVFLLIPGLLLLIIIINVLRGEIVDTIILFTLFIAVIMAYEVFRRGGINISILLLCTLMTLSATIICTIGHGIHDIAILTYPIIIGVAVFVHDRTYLALNISIIAISVVWLTIGEKLQLFIPEPIESGSFSDLVITSIIIIFAGVLSYYLTKNLKFALESHHQKLTERIEAITVLNKIVIEKDGVIREIHKKVTDSISRVYSLINFMAVADEDKIQILSDLKNRISAIETAHEILYNKTATEWLSLSEYLALLLDKLQYGSRGLNVIKSSFSEDIDIHIDDVIPFGICTIEMLLRVEGVYPSEIELKSSSGKVSIELKNLSKIRFDEQNQGISLLEIMIRQIKGELSVREDKEHTIQTLSFTVRKPSQNGK